MTDSDRIELDFIEAVENYRTYVEIIPEPSGILSSPSPLPEFFVPTPVPYSLTFAS
jgi:hypothetical protein